MLVDNHYVHCGEEWTVEGCDSFHNDRCPKCETEIQPYQSTEYTEEGTKELYHTSLDDVVEDAGDDMGKALQELIDKITGIRGIDMDIYAGTEIEKAEKALAHWEKAQKLKLAKGG